MAATILLAARGVTEPAVVQPADLEAATTGDREFPEEPAVYLEDHTQILFTPTDEFIERHVRVLVRSREGYDVANQFIPPYDRTNTILESFQARTILPDGGSIEIPEGLMRDFVVLETDKELMLGKQFSFPGVRPGVVLEWRYKLKRSEHAGSWSWPVQRERPVLDATFEVRLFGSGWRWVPDFRAVTRADYGSHCGVLPAGPRRDRKPLIFGLRCSEVPSFEEVALSPPARDRSIAFLITMEGTGTLVQDWLPTALREYWEERVQKCATESQAVREFAMRATGGATDEDDRVKAIFRQFRDEVHVSSGASAKECRNASEVLMTGVASPSEAIFLLLAAFRAANIPADLVLANDRTTGKFDRRLPDASQYAHVLVLVGTGGGRRFVDPVCTYCPLGVVPWQFSGAGSGGLRLGLSDGDPGLVMIPAMAASRVAAKYTSRTVVGADGTGSTETEILPGVYDEIEWREILDPLSAEEREGVMRATLDLVDQGAEVEVYGLDDPDRPLRVLVRSDTGSPAARLGSDLLLFPPDIGISAWSFPYEERRGAPIWWPRPRAALVEGEFELPGSAWVVDVPPRRKIEGPGMYFDAEWGFDADSGRVTWRSGFVRHVTFLPPEEEKAVRQFVREVSRMTREGIRIRPSGSPD